MKEKYLILFIILAYASLEMWTLLPSAVYVEPFPFSDVKLNFQTYIWMATIKVVFMIFCYVILQYSTWQFNSFFNIVFWFALAEVVEYFLNYNEPWFKILSIPVDVTSIRYTVLIYMAFRLWKQIRS